MKRILFSIVLVLVLVLEGSCQTAAFKRTGTNLSFLAEANPTWPLLIERGGGLHPANITLRNLMTRRNDYWTAGHQFRIQTTNSNPGTLMFDTESHDGGARGIVLLGATTGDVVINPSTAGVFQIGQSGNAGTQHYMQYASYPDAGNPMGFSHPLQFRVLAYNGGSVAWKYPGLVSFAAANDASEQGRMVIYSRVPKWDFGNKNPNAPNTAGTEVASFGTNGVVASLGIKFIGNGGSLTNDAGQLLGTGGGGGSGLTTNCVVMSAGQPLVQYFTNGSLAAISTDTDASNYIAAVIATGASLTDNQKLAVTKFTVSRKWFNTWSDADVIAPIVGGTAAAHAVMLKGTNSMTYANTPTHDANGIAFNGTSSYADTGFRPSIAANYSQNSARVVIVSPTASAVPTVFGQFVGTVGTTGGTSRMGLFRNSSSALSAAGMNNGDGNMQSLSVSDHRGVMMETRETSTLQYMYFWQHTAAIGASGISASGLTTASVSAPPHNVMLGARGYEGFAADQFQAYTVSGFETGAKATSAQAQTIRDAWAQLQRDLSR